MSGGGNDFIVLDASEAVTIRDPAAFARLACRRGSSVGADGVLVVGVGEGGVLRLIHRNADGGRSALCGNGTRCAARWAWDRDLVRGPTVIETDAGPVRATSLPEGGVRLGFPLRVDPPVLREVMVGEDRVQGYLLQVGVPHLLVRVPRVEDVDVAARGAAIRRAEPFRDAGINVSFVARRADGDLDIRTYERGVEAETLSCGTGCVAAGVMALAAGWSTSAVSCHTRSGVVLAVRAAPSADGYGDLELAGDARRIYEGLLGPEALLP
jgi:diaminopimelate epimerase